MKCPSKTAAWHSFTPSGHHLFHGTSHWPRPQLDPYEWRSHPMLKSWGHVLRTWGHRLESHSLSLGLLKTTSFVSSHESLGAKTVAETKERGLFRPLTLDSTAWRPGIRALWFGRTGTFQVCTYLPGLKLARGCLWAPSFLWPEAPELKGRAPTGLKEGRMRLHQPLCSHGSPETR